MHCCRATPTHLGTLASSRLIQTQAPHLVCACTYNAVCPYQGVSVLCLPLPQQSWALTSKMLLLLLLLLYCCRWFFEQLGSYKVKVMLAEPKTKRPRTDLAAAMGLFGPVGAVAGHLPPVGLDAAG